MNTILSMYYTHISVLYTMDWFEIGKKFNYFTIWTCIINYNPLLYILCCKKKQMNNWIKNNDSKRIFFAFSDMIIEK